MLEKYLAAVETISFSPEHVKELIKYGFEKIKATVSVQGTLTYRKQKYIVVVGAEKFSRHQSTKVYISHVDGKLLIFEYKKDGIFLGAEPDGRSPHGDQGALQEQLPSEA